MTNTTSVASLMKLRSSLIPSQTMLSSDRILLFLLFEAEGADAEEHREGDEQNDQIPHHQAGRDALGVGAQARVHVVGGRPDRADDARRALERRDRLQQPGELDRRLD